MCVVVKQLSFLTNIYRIWSYSESRNGSVKEWRQLKSKRKKFTKNLSLWAVGIKTFSSFGNGQSKVTNVTILALSHHTLDHSSTLNVYFDLEMILLFMEFIYLNEITVPS